MPVTGERKRELQAAWKARRYTPKYHRWLYARRKVRWEIADMLRLAVEEAVAADGDVVVLQRALAAADEWEREVGNRFDHDRQKPYYLTEDGVRLTAGKEE